MKKKFIPAALLGLASAASLGALIPTRATAFIPPPPVPVAFPYEVLDPAGYQVFVERWSPPSEPHCVAIHSASEWARNFHPAPAMRSSRPFSPPEVFWRDHIVLLFARAMPMTSVDDAITVEGVDEVAGRLRVQLRLHIVDSSATMNAWTGIVIGRPDWLGDVAFRIGNETICSLRTSAKG
jgi:hypothetical protein